MAGQSWIRQIAEAKHNRERTRTPGTGTARPRGEQVWDALREAARQTVGEANQTGLAELQFISDSTFSKKIYVRAPERAVSFEQGAGSQVLIREVAFSEGSSDAPRPAAEPAEIPSSIADGPTLLAYLKEKVIRPRIEALVG